MTKLLLTIAAEGPTCGRCHLGDGNHCRGFATWREWSIPAQDFMRLSECLAAEEAAKQAGRLRITRSEPLPIVIFDDLDSDEGAT